MLYTNITTSEYTHGLRLRYTGVVAGAVAGTLGCHDATAAN